MAPIANKKKKVIFLRNYKDRNKQKRVDVNVQGSKHTGLLGLYEKLFRRFVTAVYLLTIAPLYMLGGVFMGLCLAPGIYLYHSVFNYFPPEISLLKTISLGLSIGVGFFLFGFSLILLVPLSNFIMRTYPKIFRGPYYSVDFIRWLVHNSLTYLVRYTFLEFITPTPFNLLFFKLMGMKIGKGTQINSSNISDPALIELGNFVTIGGSATICAHYGQGGYLVLAPVRIGNNVTIGLKASVMGGVEIGDGAKVMPHSVVLPKTVIPAGEIWGGVPAAKISLKTLKKTA